MCGSNQDECHATAVKCPIPAGAPFVSLPHSVAPPCYTGSRLCVSDQDVCHATVMMVSIPRGCFFFALYGVELGREIEIGCGACSSRDGMTDYR